MLEGKRLKKWKVRYDVAEAEVEMLSKYPGRKQELA